MTNIQIYIEIAKYAIGFVGALVPCIIGICVAVKKYKQAKNVADKETATADLMEHLKELVVVTEANYKTTTAQLKGVSFGKMKKDSVLTQLQAYATEKGYAFDREEWSAKVDEEVKFTKQVNVK